MLAYYRWSDKGTRAVVVANFLDIYLSGNSISNFPTAGTWHELMYNKIIEVGEEGFKFDLPESSAQVFFERRIIYVSRQMGGEVVQQ